MTTKEQITDWFCERNKIKKEELDKYHRYAIATVFKYAQEQAKNIAYEPVLETVKCDCTLSGSCVYEKMICDTKQECRHKM